MLRAPGWFVRERDIVAICLLAVVSILLAIKSGISDHRAANERRAAEQARLGWIAARDSMNTLLSGRWVKLGPWDRVYYGRGPGDTLPRAVR